MLVHHYHPTFLPKEEISMVTSQTEQKIGRAALDESFDDSFGRTIMMHRSGHGADAQLFDQRLKYEKENFKVLFNKVS